MIVYYSKNETDFTHNGLGVLDGYIINPIVTEELNGIFKLEFDYPIHALHGDELLPERIIRCPVPSMGDQLFRISERESNISGLLHIVAYHVFYDLAQNLIEDTFVINRTGQGAITQILSASQFPHPFTGDSDIAVVNSARLVRHNIAEILLDEALENSFLSRWGGEVLRDNFHIAMRKVRGSDNGVNIRDKKNLTGYRSDVDFGTVCTRIMPQGFDGLLLPEKYVDSPRIGSYQTPRIRVIKYDHVKAAIGDRADDEDAIPLTEAYALLRQLTSKEYSENHIDLPHATYQVEFAPLERTEEYKVFAALETIAIGDTVTVIHDADGLNISARMIGYQYDPLNKLYISVTLGNYMPRFTDVAKDIKRIDAGVKQAVEEANFALQSANGKNTNFYGSATPANPRKGDLWYKENGDKLELWVYETRDSVTQWYPLVTDLTQEELRLELEAAAQMVEEARTAAENAAQAGQIAKDAAEQAEADARDAVDKANEAYDNAAQALASLGSANTNASDALAKAETALSDARNALTTATGAQTTVTTEVTRLEGLLSSKANQTTVDTLTGRVSTTETTIVQQAGLIASKASQTTVDTLTGRVSIAESTIIQQANLINLRVTKNDVINQINISSEGILISGNRIHITGTTTIDNAVIKTAMIADAAITNAKIGNLDAGKINTGTLSADRIAAGTITSAKLSIANGYITNAMIADATIQSAKILTIDAAKITTGTLSAARIAAYSITADKLATNAIQVGLEGWSNSIRISPWQIDWYSGTERQGSINSGGQYFYRGTKFIGVMGSSNKNGDVNCIGLSTQLNGEADYILWSYRTGTSGNFVSMFTFDPKGKFYVGQPGIYLGASFRTMGYDFYTYGNRNIYLSDCNLSGAGTHPGWCSSSGYSKIIMGDSHLYIVTNGYYYTMTNIVNRVSELIGRMNSLIYMLNFGWVVKSNSTTSSYSGTGLSQMSTSL